MNVPGRPGFVYVRILGNTSELIQAYNDQVSNVYDLPVTLIRDATKYIVVGRDVARYASWGYSSYIPAHGANHSFGGTDPVWIYSEQFVPFSVSPSGTSLTIAPYVYNWNGQWKQGGNTGTSTITLPSDPTKQSVMLLYIDGATSNPTWLPGTEAPIGLATKQQLYPYLPDFSSSLGIPIAMYAVPSGTTSFNWNYLYDIRQYFMGSMSGSSGGGISEAPVDGNIYGRKNAGWAIVSGSSTTGSSYSLPTGSSSILGGYRVGLGLGVYPDGTLNVTGSNGNIQSIANVSNPPTSAELIAVLGTPDENSQNSYILNDNGAGNNTYLIVSDGGHYLVLPLARTQEVLPVLGSITTATICTGGTNSWYGRASIKELSNHTLVLVYYHSSGHSTNDGALHIRFSTDYGATWTAEDKYTDGSSVSGFPMNPTEASAGEDAGEPWLMIAPNGDLLLHMWRVHYAVTANGTYQSRSTDGGKTWSASAQIDWIGITDDTKVFATDDDFVYGGVIYIAARVYLDATPTEAKSVFIKSTDNGVTWNYVSDLSVMGSTDTSEMGMEYVGNNTIVAILRSLGNTKTYQTKSTDMGATWAALTDITGSITNDGRQRIRTRAHLKGLSNWWNDSVLIMNGFVMDTGGTGFPRINAIWVSVDRGTTWVGPLEVDSSYGDGGYGDMFWDATNRVFVFISYRGTTSNANLIQYSFPVTGI